MTAIQGSRGHKTVVILQLYDKMIHLGEEADGTVSKPFKEDNAFHIKGSHVLVGKESMKDIFLMSIPLIKTAGESPVILITPLPSYIMGKCCQNQERVTNFF